MRKFAFPFFLFIASLTTNLHASRDGESDEIVPFRGGKRTTPIEVLLDFFCTLETYRYRLQITRLGDGDQDFFHDVEEGAREAFGQAYIQVTSAARAVADDLGDVDLNGATTPSEMRERIWDAIQSQHEQINAAIAELGEIQVSERKRVKAAILMLHRHHPLNEFLDFYVRSRVGLVIHAYGLDQDPDIVRSLGPYRPVLASVPVGVLTPHRRSARNTPLQAVPGEGATGVAAAIFVVYHAIRNLRNNAQGSCR